MGARVGSLSVAGRYGSPAFPCIDESLDGAREAGMERGIDERIGRHAARSHGIVTRSAAVELGASRTAVNERLRAGRWEHLSRSTYAIAGSPATWERAATALHLATGGVVSHLAAARLRGYRPLPAGDEPEVTVGITRSARSPLGRVHRSRDLHLATVEEISGLPVTDAARTLLDLAAQVGPVRYRRIVDDALDRKLVTLGELDACLTRHRRRGRPGVRRLAGVLAERGDGSWVTESVFERRFLVFCDTHGIPRPRTQLALSCRDRVFARCDCVFEEARLIVELDGRRGHLQLVNRELDHERDQIAVSTGWSVMRVGWLQFTRRPGTLADRLRAKLNLPSAP